MTTPLNRLRAPISILEHVSNPLSVEEVRSADDLLKPVYDPTGGADGYGSIEVSPFFAHITKGTVVEAIHLGHEIGRPNAIVDRRQTVDE